MAEKDKRPEISCRQVLTKLKSLELLDSKVKKRVLERFSKTTLEAIQKTNGKDWVPVEYNIELTESVAAEIGENGAFDWSVKAVSYSMKESVIGPFFVSILSMFKFKPSSVLKVAPQLWKSIYRNCGEFSTATRGSTCAQLILTDVPLVMIRSRNYMAGIAAFGQALVEFGNGSNVKGRVANCSEDDRTALIEITWDTTNL